MRTLQRYGVGCFGPGMEDIVFQLKKLPNDPSLKACDNQKLLIFLQQSPFDLFQCTFVNY